VLGSEGIVSLRFISRPLEGGIETVHCTCEAVAAPQSIEEIIPLSVEEATLPKVGDLYTKFAAAGFHYGPAFQTSDAAANGVHAFCRLPSGCKDFPLHPAVLDSSLHLVSLLHPLGCRGVPQAIRSISLRPR